MSPEAFLENFEYLADAPNGIQKLRDLILQLAMQGRFHTLAGRLGRCARIVDGSGELVQSYPDSTNRDRTMWRHWKSSTAVRAQDALDFRVPAKRANQADRDRYAVAGTRA